MTIIVAASIIAIYVIARLRIMSEDRKKLQHWQERIDRLMERIESSLGGDRP